uniref:Cytochrome P450 n=1 Tax=Rhizophora mucronata TaxID=61149 RepID=A0A2P2MAP4_RHIMU
MNMHNGLLQAIGASLRLWLNFHQPSHPWGFSLLQLPLACSLDTILSRRLLGWHHLEFMLHVPLFLRKHQLDGFTKEYAQLG